MFQKTMPDTNITPKCLNMSQNTSKCFNMSQNYAKMIQNVSKYFKILQSDSKCLNMFQNVSKGFKMFQNDSQCFKMTLNDSKICLGAILGLQNSPKVARKSFPLPPPVAKRQLGVWRRQDATPNAKTPSRMSFWAQKVMMGAGGWLWGHSCGTLG